MKRTISWNDIQITLKKQKTSDEPIDTLLLRTLTENGNALISNGIHEPSSITPVQEFNYDVWTIIIKFLIYKDVATKFSTDGSLINGLPLIFVSKQMKSVTEDIMLAGHHLPFKNYRYGEIATKQAIIDGNLNIVSWLHDLGSRWRRTFSETIGEHNRFDIFLWASIHCLKMDLAKIVEYGVHFSQDEIVRLLHRLVPNLLSTYVRRSTPITTDIVCSGNFKLLKMAVEEWSLPIEPSIMKKIAHRFPFTKAPEREEYGKVFDYLVSKGFRYIPTGERNKDEEWNHPHMLKWTIERGYPVGTLLNVINYLDMEILNLLYANQIYHTLFTPIMKCSIITQAIKNSSTEMLEFVSLNFPHVLNMEEDLEQIMGLALACRSHKFVSWVLDRGFSVKNFEQSPLLCQSLHKLHKLPIETIELLIEHKSPIFVYYPLAFMREKNFERAKELIEAMNERERRQLRDPTAWGATHEQQSYYKGFCCKIYCDAACLDKTEILEWLYEIGIIIYGREMFNLISYNAPISILDWFMEKGELDDNTIKLGANPSVATVFLENPHLYSRISRMGRLDILKWAKEHNFLARDSGDEKKKRIFRSAVSHGRLDILDWSVTELFYPSKNPLKDTPDKDLYVGKAIYKGKLEVLQWCFRHKYAITDEHFKKAFGIKDTVILRWLVVNAPTILSYDKSLNYVASSAGDRKEIRHWVKNHRYIWDQREATMPSDKKVVAEKVNDDFSNSDDEDMTCPFSDIDSD